MKLLLLLAVTGAGLGYWYWQGQAQREAEAQAEICEVIRERPGEAMVFLSERVDGPAAVWREIERCHAPDGDACDHALVGVRSMPSMATPSAEQWRVFDSQYLKACRSLAPELQKCLLISNALDRSLGCDPGVARKALKAAEDRLLTAADAAAAK